MLQLYVSNTQRLQELIYLHLFTDCLMKISLQSSEQICLEIYSYDLFEICSDDWREIFMK